MSFRRNILALSPLILFMALYLVSSLVVGDFYLIPVSTAFLISCIYAVLISRGPLSERIATFSRGAANPNMMLMIWIFVLSGAFAQTASDMGAVEAAVNLTLGVVPPSMLFAGLFLTACFVSFSVGTSVGTIVALVPIASGIAQQGGLSVPFITAVIVGGAFFGDNISFISDTTIAATRALDCEMRDKFRANIRIILPAVIAVTVIYLVRGASVEIEVPAITASWIKLLPYLLVIVLALCGANVTLVLVSGILANSTIGLCSGDFSWTSLLASMGKGISGMGELIIVTLLAGGMLETIRANGGLDALMEGLSSKIRGPRWAQGAIALLVSLANLCTANNTVAIITTGGIAKDISERYGVSPIKAASILDTFSCFVQGLLPYGAQLLMASSLSGVSAAQIIPNLYYPFLMGICAIIAILLNYPKKLTTKT